MRESNFELLRIVSMFFIVLYHLLYYFISVWSCDAFYKALFLPLHVGVICFVLISGYFHINPSLKGIAKLLAPLIIFYLPLTIVDIYNGNGGGKSLLFFSGSSYWFIRTYLYLFLVSPLLNLFLVNNYRRLYVLLCVGFIAIYMGARHDPSLLYGKNIVLFMFLYTLGDSIRANLNIIERIGTKKILTAYLILNSLLVGIMCEWNDTLIGNIIFTASYQYYGPVLIFNALLLFVLFSRLSISSKIINWLGSSVLAVYVISDNKLVLREIIMPIVKEIYMNITDPIIVVLYLSLFSLSIVFICIIMDKLFSPVKNLFISIASKIQLYIKLDIV